jgi:hypothetical protein
MARQEQTELVCSHFSLILSWWVVVCMMRKCQNRSSFVTVLAGGYSSRIVAVDILLTSLSALSALFRLPLLPPPLPLPLTLPLPLPDVGVEVDAGVVPLVGTSPFKPLGVPTFPPPLPLLLEPDVGGGVGILSLVTMLFKTCSLAASQPGEPACAEAFALTRFRISSVDAENW